MLASSICHPSHSPRDTSLTGDINDTPASLLLEDLNNVLGEQRRRRKVDCNDAIPNRRIQGIHAVVRIHDTGYIEQDVKAAVECLFCPFHYSFWCAILSEVDLMEDKLGIV